MLAATLDVYLQYLAVNKPEVKFQRCGFQLNHEAGDLVAGIASFLGALLFFTGTIFFFPSLDLPVIARYVFRTGSCIYIVGTLYGIMRILDPSRIGHFHDESLGKATAMDDDKRLFLKLKNVSEYGHNEKVMWL